MNLEDLPRVSVLDALTLICGELIGEGLSRRVYAHATDQTRVIKFEFAKLYFQNTIEATVWKRVRDSKELARWFAPVVVISDHGRWAIQARTQPVTLEELRRKLPRVPAFFTDLKAGNWGRLGKRIVCHDYGSLLITEQGLTTRMRKADWWE